MGDRLLSTSDDGSQLQDVTVTALRYDVDALVEVVYDAGKLICSVTHPLLVRNGDGLSEVRSTELRPGDRLVLEDLSDSVVVSVESAGKGRVVMVTTDGNHLYFAGDAPVLGHNIAKSKVITTTATFASFASSPASSSGVGYGG